jgi:hypothetical protein
VVLGGRSYKELHAIAMPSTDVRPNRNGDEMHCGSKEKNGERELPGGTGYKRHGSKHTKTGFHKGPVE